MFECMSDIEGPCREAEYLLNSEVDIAEPRAPGARFILSLLVCWAAPPWLEVRMDCFESYGTPALLGEIFELLSI